MQENNLSCVMYIIGADDSTVCLCFHGILAHEGYESIESIIDYFPKFSVMFKPEEK